MLKALAKERARQEARQKKEDEDDDDAAIAVNEQGGRGLVQRVLSRPRLSAHWLSAGVHIGHCSSAIGVRLRPSPSIAKHRPSPPHPHPL